MGVKEVKVPPAPEATAEEVSELARLGKFSHALAVRRAFNARRKDNSLAARFRLKAYHI
jgi:hypothetical protein